MASRSFSSLSPSAPRSKRRKSSTSNNSSHTHAHAQASSTSSFSSSSSSSAPSLSALNFLKVDAHSIGNKQKRSEVFARIRTEKKKLKSKLRRKRAKEGGTEKEDTQIAKRQKTLDGSRESDETMIASGDGAHEDDEIAGDEATDEFAQYFKSDVTPRVCITTSYHCTKQMYAFVQDLLHTIPNSFFFSRRNFSVKDICDEAISEGYTDVVILKEDKKEVSALTHIHLPAGPTAHYKLSSLRLSKDISSHAAMTSHRPELLLNNFNTRLGKRVARMMSALFHSAPNFQGRRALTFHNSRDFIFVRQHRYIFEGKQKVRLQEMGPRFTLKLQWMQSCIFDPEKGEYEWKHQKDMDTSRKRFFL